MVEKVTDRVEIKEKERKNLDFMYGDIVGRLIKDDENSWNIVMLSGVLLTLLGTLLVQNDSLEFLERLFAFFAGIFLLLTMFTGIISRIVYRDLKKVPFKRLLLGVKGAEALERNQDVLFNYLFNIDAGLEEENLNKGVISEGLNNMFKTNGFPLSENATISTQEVNDWVITDGKKIYIAAKENGKLKIYLTNTSTLSIFHTYDFFVRTVSYNARVAYLDEVKDNAKFDKDLVDYLFFLANMIEIKRHSRSWSFLFMLFAGVSIALLLFAQLLT